jgi:hypothetical protein
MQAGEILLLQVSQNSLTSKQNREQSSLKTHFRLPTPGQKTQRNETVVTARTIRAEGKRSASYSDGTWILMENVPGSSSRDWGIHAVIATEAPLEVFPD